MDRAGLPGASDDARHLMKETIMRYPDRLSIVVPMFTVVNDAADTRSFSQRLVFLRAFAILHAVRGGDAQVTFCGKVEFDPTGEHSIDLMVKLGNELEANTTLAGWRLDHMIGSLVRLPRDAEREAEGKTPLMRLKLALGSEPVEVAWFDDHGGMPTLRQVSARHTLPADWDERISANPALIRRRLSARACTIWAAIADRLLTVGDERRKAFASFDHFQSQGGAMI